MRALLVLLFLVLSSSNAPAQSGRAKNPCGPPPQNAIDAVDSLALRTLMRDQVPGLALGMVDHGRVRVRAYGWADLERCVPASDSTVFGIGSITKQLAAFGALRLVSSGMLSLDDSITRYLWEGRDVWQGITVRHLLNHTSGIPDYANDDDKYPSIMLDRASSPETSTLVSRIAAAPLNFRPGTDWAYSNTGYLLLGVLVERAARQPFPTYMREHVFLPLGMVHTRFYSPIALISNRATPYQIDSLGTPRLGPYMSEQFTRWGDLGILSTAGDMARWLIAMDWLKLLSRALWQRMFTSTPVGAWAHPYGFGMWLGEINGVEYMAHAGTLRVGYSGQLMRLPKRGVSTIVLTNRLGPGFAKRAFTQRLLAAVDPQFTALAALPVRADPQPAITRALTALLQGKDHALRTTPAFRQLELRALRRFSLANGLSFLQCVKVAPRSPAAHGTRVVRQCTYRVNAAGEDVMFFFTGENELAGADW